MFKTFSCDFIFFKWHIFIFEFVDCLFSNCQCISVWSAHVFSLVLLAFFSWTWLLISFTKWGNTDEHTHRHAHTEVHAHTHAHTHHSSAHSGCIESQLSVSQRVYGNSLWFSRCSATWDLFAQALAPNPPSMLTFLIKAAILSLFEKYCYVLYFISQHAYSTARLQSCFMRRPKVDTTNAF